jgi:hypothetical protein
LPSVFPIPAPLAAYHLFDEIPARVRDPVCYYSPIVGLAHNGQYEESFSAFACMRRNALDSTMYAPSSALRAAAGLAVLSLTCGIHAHAVVDWWLGLMECGCWDC